MIHLTPRFYFLFIVLLSVLACKDNNISYPKEGLLITNATIVDVKTGDLLHNKHIIIKDHIIQSIVDEINIDRLHFATIDAKGKFIIPGLVDSHVHLFVKELNEWAFPEFLKFGVTGVRDMLTPIDSMDVVKRWRDQSNQGRQVPRILSAGTIVDGGDQWSLIDVNIANTETEGRAIVKTVEETGHDFIKVYSMLRPEVYKAIAEEAMMANIEISGHIPLRISLKEALEARQKTNEHLHQVLLACTKVEDSIIDELKSFYNRAYGSDEEIELLDSHILNYEPSFDQDICEEAAKAIAEAGQWQVPTLINERRWYLGLLESQNIDSLLNRIPDNIKQSWMKNLTSGDFSYSGDSLALENGWKNYKHVVKTLSENGVGFLAGTDFRAPWIYPGYSLHQELELFVESGLTPLQALQTATINPAKYLEKEDVLGSIESGKYADLIILNKNPLKDINNSKDISQVILNGILINTDIK